MIYTKLKTAAVVILFLLALIQPVKAQFQSINVSGFYLGTFHFPNIDNYHSYTYLEKLNSLRFNMLMGYTSHQNYDTICKIWGGFYDSISIYSSNIRTMVNAFNQSFWSDTFTLFFEREKILRPAYGQSTRHQAEDNPENNIPGYGFTERHGTTGSETRDNELISYRKMNKETDTMGICLKGLLENNEQVNVITTKEYDNEVDLSYLMSDRKSIEHKWFIKPRIRIDSTYAINYPDSLVAKIIVINFEGDTIMNIDIKCKNFCKFINGNFYYDGKYHEYLTNDTSFTPYFLNVTADTLAKGVISDEQGKVTNQDSSKIDIQLYWYGKVDMYVDYVKFEDEWAHYLMTDSVLSNDNQYFFKQRIQQELSIFEGLSVKTPYFLIDEYNYNMLPCIAFVDSLVRIHSGNKSGLAILTNDYWLTDYAASGLKRPPDSRFGYNSGYQFLYDTKAIKDIVLTDIYPISGKIPLPPDMTLPNLNTYPGTKNYRNAANVNDYDDTLIYIIENGIFTSNPNEYCPSFLNIFRKCLYTCKENGINNFAVALPFFTDESDPDGPYSDREPTIEEMNMLSCLALAYNANILLEFSMISRIINEDEPTYFWGLTDVPQYVESCNFTFGYRFLNYYEQPKWNSVKEIGKRLRAIGEYIFPSDDVSNIKRLNHYKTVTVDTVFKNDQLQEGFFNHLPESYVNDIQSVIYNPQAQSFDVSLQDPSGKRYWELAFFEKRNSEPLDKSKYLFALNKRCVPGELGTGDYRQLRIKFNGNYLSQFKNWLIKDAISDSVINTFPGYSSEYIIAGDFQPGEGKLLKIAPVMQEGGTLVCDESISGCSFICDSTVFNDGFDITINKDVTISFSSKGEIVMEGGEFICGADPQMSQNRVEFKGNNENWKGISLTNCDKIEILESDFKNIAYNGNDSTSRNSAVTIINSYNFNINHCNFEMSTSSGGVNILITSFDDVEWGNSIVQHSTFTAKNGNNQNAISVTSLAEIVSPVRIENCTISADNDETITTGIQLASVVQGSIKNNDISSCLYALDLINSSADIYENTINCGFDNSSGIRGKTGSSLFLNPNDCYYTGGMNYISQIGENNKNIEVIDSYFYLDEGENTLNIGDYYSGDAYYLYGNMPAWTPNTNQTGNCFQKEGNNIDIEDTVNVYCCVEDLSGDTIDFKFSPFDCDNSEPENFIVISFPGIVNDTIYKKGIVMGGGLSGENKNEERKNTINKYGRQMS